MKKMAIGFIAVFIMLLFCYAYSTPVFGGEKDLTFYVGNASSLSTAIKGGQLKPFNTYGESFTSEEKDVNKILKKYSATLIFTETIAEGVSYYAYSEKISYLKIIRGEKINLHIFVGSCVTVGSPIIFGSF